MGYPMCAPSQEKKNNANKKEGAQYKNANANRKLEPKARALLALSPSLFPPAPSRSAARVSFHCARSIDPHLLHTPHIPRSSWQSERSGLEPFVGSSFSDLAPEALAEAPYYAK